MDKQQRFLILKIWLYNLIISFLIFVKKNSSDKPFTLHGQLFGNSLYLLEDGAIGASGPDCQGVTPQFTPSCTIVQQRNHRPNFFFFFLRNSLHSLSSKFLEENPTTHFQGSRTNHHRRCFSQARIPNAVVLCVSSFHLVPRSQFISRDVRDRYIRRGIQLYDVVHATLCIRIVESRSSK